eukprot:2171257-Prymnesium_polylepis.1
MRAKARGPVPWRKRVWNQLKAQHKLLRVFYQKYDVGEDPFRLHTGCLLYTSPSPRDAHES